MVRRAFFSFHYEKDIWRASQIRNSWVTKEDREAAGFWDAAKWEEVKRGGEAAIKKWINDQLKGTSVTAVLIGSETVQRKYVGYEIEQSYMKNNGMLGIYIHKQKDQDKKTSKKGVNPFSRWYITRNTKKVYFTELYTTYDWVDDKGYDNLGKWIEKAAKQAGK